MVYILLPILLSSLLYAQDSREINPTVEVRVEPTNTASELLLEVVIQNKGSTPIIVDVDALPWLNTSSLILVVGAVKGFRFEPLPIMLRIADLAMDKMVIPAGGSLRGRVDLDDQYHTMKSDLTKTDVAVFWTYQLIPLEGSPSKRFGGWILFNKRLTK